MSTTLSSLVRIGELRQRPSRRRRRAGAAGAAPLLSIALTSAALLLAAPAQAASPACETLNDPSYDVMVGGYIQGAPQLGGPFAAGDRITISAGPPTDGGDPTAIELRAAPWPVINPATPVDTEPFPGTLQYTIPAAGEYYLDWFAMPAANVTWSVSCAAAPTATVVRNLTASRSRGGVAIRWRTASRLGILGFNVYGERSGRRAKLNHTLIAAKAQDSVSYSFLYRVPKARQAPTRYWLQTVSLDGSRVWYGPARIASARRAGAERSIEVSRSTEGSRSD